MRAIGKDRPPRPDRGPGGSAGFTLVELMIAVSVLAIGILGVASMQLTAIRGNQTAMELTSATTVATRALEYLMSMDYNNNWLRDQDGDGTGQDNVPFPNGNGVDDDDEGGAVDGALNFGLDDEGAAADWSFLARDFYERMPDRVNHNAVLDLVQNPEDVQRDYQYTIHWNVAEDVVVDDTKTINMIVTWRENEQNMRVAMERIIPSGL